MPKFNLKISHHLTEDEALKRIKNLLRDTKIQFADKINNLNEDWEGKKGKFSFSVIGFSVSGILEVDSSKAEISGNLPYAAMLFKGKVETTIRERAEALLS